ncbi:MAG: YbaB/EbfC family nucleoid-associated protein [Bacilli bacterium]|jgi:DNA-binding YbaB/EbfC family protein|nr:YbaB/EbfC family nucleoid-associated protein [Bacilli bacterium]
MDLNKLMQQAQKMQAEMKKKQDELENTVFEAEAAGGACKVRMYGNYTIDKIEIDKDAIDPNDKEMLEDMIKAAFNECVKKVKAASDKIASDMQSSIKGF